MNIQQFGESVLVQDEQKIRTYFHPKAYVNWHCTNEHFSLEEFIQANCEYPGEWGGEVERAVETDRLTITVTHVYTTDYTLSFHVTWASYQRNHAPTPYWRTLKANGELNAKFPGGIEKLRRLLEEEGHTIIERGRSNIRYSVKDYEQALFVLE